MPDIYAGIILFERGVCCEKQDGRREDMALEHEQKGGNRAKGFASMDEERKKQIASQGGLASAKGKNTSNRGFASMDKDKQREISRMGGKASRATPVPDAKDDRPADQNDVSERGAPASDQGSLDKKEKPESSEKMRDDLTYSETDEDEDEGLGDGKLGRSTRRDVLGR